MCKAFMAKAWFLRVMAVHFARINGSQELSRSNKPLLTPLYSATNARFFNLVGVDG